MKKTETYYETLLAKYFSAEANKEELAELFSWINADPSNKKLFGEYKKSWELTEKSIIDSIVDTDKEWSAFSEKYITEQESKSRTLFYARPAVFLRVAAVIILLIIPSFFIYKAYINKQTEMLIAENNVVESVLPDGTKIALNRGATLEYPAKFRNEFREVSLEGEAYFDVAHNENKAFVISSGDLKIKVLGTSFYVKANNGKAEVILSSGKVLLYYESDPGVQTMLHPGEKASTLNNEGIIVKVINEDRNFLAWKTKRFEFVDTPMSEIIELLSNVYRKEIVVLNPEILNCRITATFNQQSLEAILNVIQSTIEINVKPNGSGIEISGNGCQ